MKKLLNIPYKEYVTMKIIEIQDKTKVLSDVMGNTMCF